MSAVPPGMQYCFWFIASLQAVLVASPCLSQQNSPPSTGQRPTVVFCQLLSMSVSVKYSRTRQITTAWAWGTLCEMDLSSDVIDHLASTSDLGSHSDHLGLLESVSVQSQCPWSLLFFPLGHNYLVKCHRSLWVRLGEILTVSIFGSILGSFLKGSLSFKRFWVCTLVQIWEPTEGLWLVLFFLNSSKMHAHLTWNFLLT